MRTILTSLHVVSPLPRLCHPTFPLSSPAHHVSLSPILSSNPSPTSITHFPVFNSCMSGHVYSHVTCMTTGSTRLFANSSSNCSHIARQALPTIVATHFGIIHESSMCPSNFYDTLYFILQIIPYMFHPPSIRLPCHMKTFLENTYIQLQLNLG